jgi:hypothetical protein
MVGHIPVDLRHHRTLASVYLDPILKILDDRNTGRQPNSTWVGLFEDDPLAEAQLVIDFVRPSYLYHTSLTLPRSRMVLPCGHTCFKLLSLS